mgnify:CR=1 FL=1
MPFIDPRDARIAELEAQVKRLAMSKTDKDDVRRYNADQGYASQSDMTTAQNDIDTLEAALAALDARVTALEGP